MTTHPLASDPTVPANIRAAFARVSHQVVSKFDNGESSVMSCVSERTANEKRDMRAAHIGCEFWNRGATARTRLVSVDVVPL